MAAKAHRRDRAKQARSVLSALMEFWPETVAVVFLAVRILLFVDGRETNEIVDPCRPLHQP